MRWHMSVERGPQESYEIFHMTGDSDNTGLGTSWQQGALRGDWNKENKMFLWMLLESSFQALDSRGKKHELLTKNTTSGWRGKSVQQQELNFQSWMGEDKWEKEQLLNTGKQRQLMYSWIKKRVPLYWCTVKGCTAKLKGYETYLSYSVLERALVR